MKYNFPNNFKSKVNYNYNLSKSTWFQTNCNTNIYCHAYNNEDLKLILSQTPSDIPVFIIGVGSNLLIRDGGFEGLIIKLGKEFGKFELNNDKILVGPSVLDKTLSKFALNKSIKNLEFYSGIPGTLGGAIKMNAGCYGSETKDVVIGATIIDRLGNEKFFSKKDLNFNYRSSAIRDNDVIKEVMIDAKIGIFRDIKLKMDEIIKKRESSQPLLTKTGGSTFKNPKGFFAAKLIEESDCKGMIVGDATVSTKHANFLINQNKASAKDIETLGERIREKVYKKFNILLEWEIKIIGKK